jgi:hypothetical protein
MSMDELYDATRRWRVLGPKRQRAKYALAVADESFEAPGASTNRLQDKPATSSG